MLNYKFECYIPKKYKVQIRCNNEKSEKIPKSPQIIRGRNKKDVNKGMRRMPRLIIFVSANRSIDLL